MLIVIMQAKGSKKASKKPGANIKIALDIDSSTPFFYVNCFEVSSSANDFSLSGTRMPVKLSEEQKEDVRDGGVTFPADLQIIFPPRVMPALIKALTSQFEAHKAAVANTDTKEVENESR